MIHSKNELSEPDTIIKTGSSLIQHGSLNDRVYIMKADPADCTETIQLAKKLSTEKGYSKIFAKVSLNVLEFFKAEGFQTEAAIGRTPENGGDISFMSLFCKQWRNAYNDYDQCSSILESIENRSAKNGKQLPDGWSMGRCGAEDAEEMAALYSVVFQSYPFPIDEPGYIRKTISDGIRYYFVKDSHSRILALSSAEFDKLTDSSEMSDFATLPDARGKNCAGNLLRFMETENAPSTTPYTIARAVMAPMNKVFAHNGYVFGGTLKQNTRIGGQDLEDMNVWYKSFC